MFKLFKRRKGYAGVSGAVWAEVQRQLGCSEPCRFADKRAFGIGPCCTYYHRPELSEADGQMVCLTKRLFDRADKGMRADA